MWHGPFGRQIVREGLSYIMYIHIYIYMCTDVLTLTPLIMVNRGLAVSGSIQVYPELDWPFFAREVFGWAWVWAL